MNIKITHKYSTAYRWATLFAVVITTALFLAAGYFTDPFTSGLTGSRFVLYFCGYELLAHVDPGYMRHLLTTADLSNSMTFAAFSAGLKYTLAQTTLVQYIELVHKNFVAYAIYWFISTLIFSPLLALIIFGFSDVQEEVEINEKNLDAITKMVKRQQGRF